MDDLIKIGKYVNTHGIKGEIRLLSRYGYVEELQPGNIVFINKKKFKIKTTRKHKNFILIFFEGVHNINDIEHLKGNDVFAIKVNKKIIIPEFIDYGVYQNGEEIGTVIDFKKQGSIYSLIVKKKDGGVNYLPMVEQFIDSIESKQINIKEITM